jgi:hypothetical protein
MGETMRDGVVTEPYMPEPDGLYLVNEQDLVQLDQVFTYHSPKAGQLERYEALRNLSRALAYRTMVWCPPSRERLLALTNLEQFGMWANAAIARGE